MGLNPVFPAHFCVGTIQGTDVDVAVGTSECFEILNSNINIMGLSPVFPAHFCVGTIQGTDVDVAVGTSELI
jgi:hypothetical protein